MFGDKASSRIFPLQMSSVFSLCLKAGSQPIRIFIDNNCNSKYNVKVFKHHAKQIKAQCLVVIMSIIVKQFGPVGHEKK